MFRRLRLLWTLLKAFFRKPSTARDVSILQLRITPFETDISILNHSLFTFFGEVARLDFMIRCGLYKVLWQRRALSIIASESIRYLKPVRLFQKLTVKTDLIAWDEKWLYASHTFEGNGSVVAVMIVKGLFRSKAGVIPTISILQALNLPSDSPPFPEMLTKWQDSETDMVTKLAKKFDSVATKPKSMNRI